MTPLSCQVSSEEKILYEIYKKEELKLESLRKEAIFTALKLSEFDVFKKIVGTDLNLRENGYSLLALVEDPDLFIWLLEKGARYINPECPPHSSGVLFHIQQRSNPAWLPYLVDLIRNTPLKLS